MDAQTLHTALLQPEAYPEKTSGVGFRETHISRLYFTDRHVYKVKKPVDFGFLNFTTPDRRRFYCNEEVRLNQRFCPDIYLGVLEIREEEGRIRLDGPGRTVDYAVVMKRLPEDRMLDVLIEHEAPCLPAEMDRLAGRIARFHQQAQVCFSQAGETHLDVVRRNWQENFTQAAAFVGRTLASTALDLTERYVADYLDRHASLLRSREEKGLVREGHGDLHAEHICLTEPICVYDCIEFNRRFRVADIAADLAFLLMDLDFRQRRDLADRLLNRYRAEMGEDSDLPVLLPFYKVYRAWVRGKVESFLLDDTGVSPQVRERARLLATRHFNLALGYLWPAGLILTCGLMGTGKTTLARALAAATGARHLRSDVLRKELAGIAVDKRHEEPYGRGIYSEKMTRRTYRRLLRLAEQTLTEDKAVIVDASFARKEDRQAFQRLAGSLGLPFLILHLRCLRETALERLDRRRTAGGDASDGRRELYARQASLFEPPGDDERVLSIDTARDVDYNNHLIICHFLQQAGMRQ